MKCSRIRCVIFACLSAVQAYGQADLTRAPGTTVKPIVTGPPNVRMSLQPVITEYAGEPLGFLTDIAFDANGRIFLVDLTGLIRVADPEGRLLAEPFLVTPSNSGLEHRDRDYGLTTLALHPQFLEQGTPGYGKFYTVEALEPTNPLSTGYDFTPPHIGTGPWGNPKITDPTHDSQLVEYTVDPTQNHTDLDAANRRVLLSLHQPHHSHNLGDIAFDDAGLLYLTSADGGNGTGYELNANSLDNLYGKMLRIDPLTLTDTADRRVWAPTPASEPRFSVPTDNPHFTDDGQVTPVDMIVAYGLRNLFRVAFDGDWLYYSNTGQSNVESFGRLRIADILDGTSRGDLGWGLIEGSFIHFGDSNYQLYADTDNMTPAGRPLNEYLPTAVSVALDDTANPRHVVRQVEGSYPGNIKDGEHRTTRELTAEEVDRVRHVILPLFEYDHTVGLSAIGGGVYRGSAVPELQGLDVFAEFQGPGPRRDGDGRTIGESARLFYGNPDTTPDDPGHGVIHEMRLATNGRPLPDQVISFGSDPNGEMYLVGFNLAADGIKGQVLRFAPAAEDAEDYGDGWPTWVVWLSVGGVVVLVGLTIVIILIQSARRRA